MDTRSDISSSAGTGMLDRESQRSDSSNTPKVSSKKSLASTSKNDMKYHYAGKVHVRGLLRRVWRPRYLALGDDGYLRYHESVPPFFQQKGSQFNQSMYNRVRHTHRPKTILAVLDGARTIDPYSVVDQHVALPEGVYGFVFRGRPVELTMSSSICSSNSVMGDMTSKRYNHSSGSNRDAIIVPSKTQHDVSAENYESAKAVVNAIFPKGSSRRKTAQKLAKAAINPDVLCGLGRNCDKYASLSSGVPSLMEYDDDDIGMFEVMIDHVRSIDDALETKEVDCKKGILPNNDGTSCNELTESSLNVMQVQVQSATFQSREYLCAVPTIEEAECWVVALKWAAERRWRNSDCKHKGTIVMGTNKVKKHNQKESNERQFSNNDIDTRDGLMTREVCKENNTISSEEYCANSKESLTSLEDSWCKAEDESEIIKDANSTGVATDGGGTTYSAVKYTLPSAAKSEVAFPILTEKSSEDDPILQTLLEPMRTEFDKESNSGPQLLKNCFETLGSESSSAVGCSTNTRQFTPNEVIFTKVRRFRFPKKKMWGYGFQLPISIPIPLPGDVLDLEYEIGLLMLEKCEAKDTSVINPYAPVMGKLQCTDKGTNLKLNEERTIHKSIKEILLLINDLKAEFSCANKDSESTHQSSLTESGDSHKICLSETDQLFEAIDDIESALIQGFNSGLHQINLVRGSTQVLSEISASIKAVNSTIDLVDHAITSLSNNHVVRSSFAFHDFFCLHSPHHLPSAMLVTEEATNHLVRDWLSKRDSQSLTDKMHLAFVLTIRHQFGGPMLLSFLLLACVRCIGIFYFMIFYSSLIIKVPIESFVTLIVLSFYYGHKIGRDSLFHPNLLGVQQYNHKSKIPTADNKYSNESNMTPPDEDNSTVADEVFETEDELLHSEKEALITDTSTLSSPIPCFPENKGRTCWSKPDDTIFMVRGKSYLVDRLKIRSSPAVFPCRGVDVWITDNAERNISRYPCILGGKLHEENTFLVNFLLPFANFVAYFTVPHLEQMPRNVAQVWSKFLRGDQEYRDGKLKLLPVVVDGPWIVRKAVGPGTSPAMIGRDLPLQYYFTEPTAMKKGVYEVDVLVTASRIARGILNVVKGHASHLTLAFAFIIEAVEQSELPETVLCAFQVHSLDLEDCPCLPDYYVGDSCD